MSLLRSSALAAPQKLLLISRSGTGLLFSFLEDVRLFDLKRLTCELCRLADLLTTVCWARDSDLWRFWPLL